MSAPRGRTCVDNTDQQEREFAKLMFDIATGRIPPPEVRLAQQLREIFGKWDAILKDDRT
jgi:hypothetical protein